MFLNQITEVIRPSLTSTYYRVLAAPRDAMVRLARFFIHLPGRPEISLCPYTHASHQSYREQAVTTPMVLVVYQGPQALRLPP